MRALDLFIERKQLNDRSNDSSSRAFSREVNDQNKHLRTDLSKTGGSDKVSFATFSMAFGAPFMFLGLGAAFFDELSTFKGERGLRDLKAGKNGLQPLRKSLFATEDDKKPLTFEQPAASSIIVSLDLNERKSKKGKRSSIRDRVLFSDPSRNERQPFLASGRNSLEASKLSKRKQFLLDQIERINNGTNFLRVTSLLAKIELLEKALKRMGG